MDLQFVVWGSPVRLDVARFLIEGVKCGGETGGGTGGVAGGAAARHAFQLSISAKFVRLDMSRRLWCIEVGPRKVDIRLPGKGNSESHGARPVH